MTYEKADLGTTVYDYDSFVPGRDNKVPYTRIMDYITVGPFVLETDGSFEAEHMYERDKLLYEDYLSEDGGEKNIVPVLGGKVKNNYYGDAYLKWQKGFIKWNSLRFDREGDACDPALYATEQRNAVYYAAFYVKCSNPEKAIITYVNSGSSLFVNGELVDFRPFGAVKGLDGLGYQCLVSFRKGINLVMFKIRPGYIADTMDISMETCCILPVIAGTNGLNISTALPTYAYIGTEKKPRMVFHMFAAAGKNTPDSSLKLDGMEYEIPEMKSGGTTVLHVGVLSGKENEIRKCRMTLLSGNSKSTADMYFQTSPYDGYKGNEHIFSDFHFDTTYHQEQRTYALGAFHITKCITENLENNPDFKAVLSEVDYLHPYYTLYPGHRETIRKAFESGRAEADCFYNQPNDLTSSGEAFVRNMAYGQIYHRDVLGRISRVYVPGDVFGHFSQMTQVCSKGGCDYIRWGKMVLGLDNLFRHMSPDGTVMLHDKCFGRYDAKRFEVGGCGHSSEAASYVEAYPRCGDTSWMKDTVNHARFSVFSDMADDIIESYEENVSKGKNHLVALTSRDLTQHHSGVLLTRTDFKQANRLCENLLVSAEKFAAVAFVYGAKYPEKALDKAWRQLLCAQHHDSITGTNNEISFVDLMGEYRECAETASDVLKRAAEYIASAVKTEKTGKLFVFNPVASDVSGLCEFTLPDWFNGKYGVATDLSGKKYPLRIAGRKASFLTGKIPATGYSLYRLEEREVETDTVICGNDNVIENNRLRLTVDKRHGGIVSIFDKKEKKEFIDLSEPASGNAIYILHEIHDRMETQHEMYTTGEKMVSDEFSAEISSRKCGDYQKLVISTVMGTVARVIREITLYRNADTVDFRTIVEDYNSDDHMFCTTFPMNVRGGAVIYDDRFAPHVSTRSKKYMSFQTHQYSSFSGCRVLPSNRWFGIGPSVTLKMKSGRINAGMTAVIRKDENSQINASEKLLTAFTKKGVPVTLYPDSEQHGGWKIIHFNEDIYETDTRFVLCISGDGNIYAEKLLSGFSKAKSDKYNECLNKYGIASAYITDSDNAYGKPVDVILVTAADGNILDSFVSDLCEQLSYGYEAEIKHLVEVSKPDMSDNYGACIINNGTIACSVEGRSTLNMMLFHTASFYGNMGKVTDGDELVPERKTHIFTYQLYTHRNSYREADVYGKAGIFNERLFAVAPEKQMDAPFLPERKSFLESDKGFEITAMKASGYPMAAMKNETLPASERGITIRGYDTEGLSHEVSLKTGFKVKNIESTNLLEECGMPVKSKGSSVRYTTGPHSIDTFTMLPCEDGNHEYRILGTEKDITEPTYVRSWEHDMGSVATGNLKFAATLDKKPVKTGDASNCIKLNAVNNSADSIAETEISIVCSKGIKADRKKVKICLAPGMSSVTDISVARTSPDTKGQVTIYYEYDGQKFTDVYEFGYFNPDVALSIEANKMICTVVNTGNQKLEGSLILATPFETWGNVIGNVNAYGTISPMAYHVELEPFGKSVYEFTCDYSDDEFFKAYFAAVKLCCNGRIHFAFADRHGPRHNVWAHEFVREICEDNGSIKKLLEM